MDDTPVTERMCRERHGHLSEEIKEFRVVVQTTMTRLSEQIVETGEALKVPIEEMHKALFVDNGGKSVQTKIAANEAKLAIQEGRWRSFMRVFWILFTAFCAATVGLLISSGCVNCNTAVSVWRSGAATESGQVENTSGAGGEVDVSGLPK